MLARCSKSDWAHSMGTVRGKHSQILITLGRQQLYIRQPIASKASKIATAHLREALFTNSREFIAQASRNVCGTARSISPVPNS